MRRLSRWLLVLFFLATLTGQALAVPIQATPAPAPRTGVLPVVAQISEQIQALVSGEEKPAFEPQETFGTKALGIILESLKLIGEQASSFFDNFAALPQLLTWFETQANTPRYAEVWMQVGQVSVMALGAAFAAAWLLDLLLLPFRRRIYRRTYGEGWGRLGGALTWLLLAIIPVASFLAAALFVVDAQDPGKASRFIIMTVIYAFALLKFLRVATKFFLAPRCEGLRLFPVSSENAVYILNAITWLGTLGIFGFFFVDIAKAVKVPEMAISGFVNLTALLIVGIAIGMILQKRATVSVFLRGNLSAATPAYTRTMLESFRLWLARTWHVLAIAYLVIGYFITVFATERGFMLMKMGTFGTLLTLVLMRATFYFLERLGARRSTKGGSALSRPILARVASAIVWFFGAVGLAASWGVDVGAIMASPWGQRVLGSVFSIGSTLVIVVLIYELLHRAIERHLNRVDEEGNPIANNTRARTLLPMLRKAAFIVLGVIVALVTLSELGVNIAPLLAGAGVLGVALGFGSQTLIKDFLTGLFIILEDNMAVGDIVTIGGNAGVIEDMSLRTVRLRAFNGSLHIIPFSEITTIVNDSKDYSQAVIDVGVAYDTDLERVMALLKKVAAEVRQDPTVAHLILADIEVLGVQALGDSSITLRNRIKVKPGERGTVERYFRLKIKQAFDAEKIEIPFPTVMQVTKKAD